MDDKNLHIDPSLQNKYPVPDTPVDQAWESMHLLLDTPVNDATPPKPATPSFKWKRTLFALLILGIICLLSWWFLLKKMTENFNAPGRHVNNTTTNNNFKRNTGQQINDSINIVVGEIKSVTQSTYSLNKIVKTIGDTDGKAAHENSKNGIINSPYLRAHNSNKHKIILSNNIHSQSADKNIVFHPKKTNANKYTISLSNNHKKINNLKFKIKHPKQQVVTVVGTNLNAVNNYSTERILSVKPKINSINLGKKKNKTINKKSSLSNSNLKMTAENKLLLQSSKISKNNQSTKNLLTKNFTANDITLNNKKNNFTSSKTEPSFDKKKFDKLATKKEANGFLNVEDSLRGTDIESRSNNIFDAQNKTTLNYKKIKNSKVEDKIAGLNLPATGKSKAQIAIQKNKRNRSISTQDAGVTIEGTVANSQYIKAIAQGRKQTNINLSTFNSLSKTEIDPEVIGYRNYIISSNKSDHNISRQSGISEYKSRGKNSKQRGQHKLLNAYNAGFQWNVAIPLQKTSDYFTGSKNVSQPLQLLLPTLWISRKINENELMVSFNFSQQNFTGYNFAVGSRMQTSTIDSSTLIINTIVKKTFGFAAGIQYNYKLNKNLNLELGFKYNSQGGGAILSTQTIEQSTGNVLNDSSYTIAKSLLAQNQLKSSFISTQIGVVYNIKKVGVGLTFLLPLSNLAISPLSLKPVAAQLFIRWRIKK